MTPKRIVGIIAFIFLGILVYSVASIDYQNSFNNADHQQAIKGQAENTTLLMQGMRSGAIVNASNDAQTITWRPPIIDAGKNTPLVITALLEGFVLICWIVLIKVEPLINGFVERAVENAKKKD